MSISRRVQRLRCPFSLIPKIFYFSHLSTYAWYTLAAVPSLPRTRRGGKPPFPLTASPAAGRAPSSLERGLSSWRSRYDWIASEAKRVLREVWQARKKERRLMVTSPVACARRVRLGTRGNKSDAGSLYLLAQTPISAWESRAR